MNEARRFHRRHVSNLGLHGVHANLFRMAVIQFRANSAFMIVVKLKVHDDHDSNGKTDDRTLLDAIQLANLP